MKRTIFFVFVICYLLAASSASAKEYDGIWFLGFNLQKPPFNGLLVRQAISHCLDLNYISTKIAEEKSVPASYIPPMMAGFDPKLKPFKQNIAFAKKLMKQAGYLPTNPKLKNLTLLHTDGLKTIEIANKIQNDLKNIGMKIELVQVNYWDENKWERELSSGRHHLFLMGYKAEVEHDTARLLGNLFRANGEVNFTNYANPAFDTLMEQAAIINPAMRAERETLFFEANRLLYYDLPAIVFFYIEKI